MSTTIYCPKCGKPDQLPDTYCRQCGQFLPDFAKLSKKGISPEQHVLANTVLNSMTIVASFTLAILLWSMLAFRKDTHPLIYVTAGVLIAIGCWHIQTLWRTLQLRKYLKKESVSRDVVPELHEKKQDLLYPADLESVVPDSITDRTTSKMSVGHPSSKPEH